MTSLLSDRAVKAAFRKAFSVGYTLMLGLFFLGVGYGVYARGCELPSFFPICMAAAIFAGSMEFLTIGLLLGAYNPLYAFFLTLIVNGRHLFYGISIFGKYKDTGWKKPWLVSGLIDESFSVNYILSLPDSVDKDWFMLFITMFFYASWVGGTSLGAVCGDVLTGVKGVEFVMPSLFIVIFVSQWQKESSHIHSLTGLIMAAVCLFLFGETYFLLPSLLFFTLWESIKYLRICHSRE